MLNCLLQVQRIAWAAVLSIRKGLRRLLSVMPNQDILQHFNFSSLVTGQFRFSKPLSSLTSIQPFHSVMHPQFSKDHLPCLHLLLHTLSPWPSFPFFSIHSQIQHYSSFSVPNPCGPTVLNFQEFSAPPWTACLPLTHHLPHCPCPLLLCTLAHSCPCSSPAHYTLPCTSLLLSMSIFSPPSLTPCICLCPLLSKFSFLHLYLSFPTTCFYNLFSTETLLLFAIFCVFPVLSVLVTLWNPYPPRTQNIYINNFLSNDFPL